MNSRLLRARMLENKISIDQLASLLSIHPATLYRKLSNDNGTFTIKEAYKIVELLNLSSNDALSIFFDGIVADKRQPVSNDI
ncbi:helix-turn-helix transcriptional regulator [Erysipelothrix rhusiopathiae]|nr:helix-turn-helix transcriptional regulator [Erysipelothrix rhusiopathiae]MDE8119199.1 helix-turn-helix transcriptional regulator [Erysipelothrix rhusiopathiae]MDE8132747.1 helix-turn-helix transcriptional regulator [Erysipelothrix rhusiopathiae]MDE8146952.1 helix-turn-helix transcriptional regulator [Erysipelothrix rhusiopathiae]MDE8162743.1 helix-turn-helix transcriptional regulator [Erysipelothrix rhusiopathiae]